MTYIKSMINFIHSILVIPKINTGYLIDEGLKTYCINNFIEDKKEYLFKGLQSEYITRNKLETIPQNIKELMNKFLSEVTFVVTLDKDEYIKEIIHFKEKNSYSNDFYENIFNEIRDKQSTFTRSNHEDCSLCWSAAFL